MVCVVPLPTVCWPTNPPSEGEVPYSNHALVEAPLGFTEPLNVALVWEMEEAERVAAKGAIESALPAVVNVRVFP